jgi:hypothetical protein
LTIKVGDRVRVRDNYCRDAYHGQEGVIYLHNDRDLYYFKSEEVVLSFNVGTSFGFDAKHLEVIEPAPLTDQELADEWRASLTKLRECRSELQKRGYKTQYRHAGKFIWSDFTPNTAETEYRAYKSVTTVEETVL